MNGSPELFVVAGPAIFFAFMSSVTIASVPVLIIQPLGPGPARPLTKN
jgi:hypothetical protein